MPRKEAPRGECTQDDNRAVDPFLTCARLVSRRIADQLGIDRETVSRYVRLARSAVQPNPSDLSKPAIAPIDPVRVSADSNPATPAPIGSGGTGRPSHCAPWQEFILAKHGQGLSAQRIHQDLRAQSGTERISYDSVRRFLKRVGAARLAPVRRLECAPGQEAQVDFGTGAAVIGPDGQRRRTHVFRIVLSHSRKAYSEACFRQTTEDFLCPSRTPCGLLAACPRHS